MVNQTIENVVKILSDSDSDVFTNEELNEINTDVIIIGKIIQTKTTNGLDTILEKYLHKNEMYGIKLFRSLTYKNIVLIKGTYISYTLMKKITPTLRIARGAE